MQQCYKILTIYSDKVKPVKHGFRLFRRWAEAGNRYLLAEPKSELHLKRIPGKRWGEQSELAGLQKVSGTVLI